MKTKNLPHSKHKNQALTLGDLIWETYSSCGNQMAPRLLQLAMESQVVRLAKRPQIA